MSSAKSLFKHYASNFHDRICEIYGEQFEPRMTRELYMDLFVKSPTRGFGNFCALLEKQPDVLRAIEGGPVDIASTMQKYGLPEIKIYSLESDALSEQVLAYLRSNEPTPVAYEGGGLWALPKEHPAHYTTYGEKRMAYNAPCVASWHCEGEVTVAQYMGLVQIPLPRSYTGVHPVNGQLSVEVELASGRKYVVTARVSDCCTCDDLNDDISDAFHSFSRKTYRRGMLYVSELYVELNEQRTDIAGAIQGVLDVTARDVQECMLAEMERVQDYPEERIEAYKAMSEEELADAFDAIADAHPENMEFLKDRAISLLVCNVCYYRCLDNRTPSIREEYHGHWDDCDDENFLSVRIADRATQVGEWEAFNSSENLRSPRTADFTRYLTREQLDVNARHP